MQMSQLQYVSIKCQQNTQHLPATFAYAIPSHQKWQGHYKYDAIHYLEYHKFDILYKSV